MSKKIIEKETTEHGSVIIKTNLGGNTNSIWFTNETELRTFAFLLKEMVETGAESINIE